MTILIAILFCLVAVFLVVLVFRQHQSGEVELLSVRNVAILGFIIFQCTSTAIALITEDTSQYVVNNFASTGFMFLCYVLVFLFVALKVYKSGWVSSRMAGFMPTAWIVPHDGVLVLMAFVATMLSIALKFASTLGVFGIVASTLSVGMGAVAAGLVGWAWGRRLLNPLLVIVGVIVVAINFGIALQDTFGRRGLVAIGGALLWGMYYSHWRYLPMGGLMKRLALVCIPPILFVAAFTSVRGGTDDRTSSGNIAAIVSGANLKSGLVALFSGQQCGAVSLWLLEAYPEDHQYRNMSMLWHFIIYPVPRILWEDKPLPLSSEIPHIAQLEDVPRDALTIGPGIIGTAQADGGFPVLLLYAVLAGLFLRFFDELVRKNPYSPFIILPIGSALGHILGLPRGSASAFGFLSVMTIFGTLIIMVMIGKAVQMGKQPAYLVEGEDEFDDPTDESLDDEDYDEEYDEEYGGAHAA